MVNTLNKRQTALTVQLRNYLPQRVVLFLPP
jgi:hypothetical protein